MRGLRWLLGGLVLLVGLALAGVWLLPSVLDWNRYRDVIAELASQRIGRPVRIQGAVSLSLLPQPMLTADDVSMPGEAGGVTVTAKALRLRVALGPLLAGRVDARDLVLRGLDVRVPWHPGEGAVAESRLGAAAAAMRAPDWLAALSARIEHGRLSVGALVFTDIDASLATSDGTGSYVAAGTARISGHAWHFTARLTRPGGDGAVGIDLSLDGQDKAVGLGATLSGQIGADGTLSGQVAGRGPDLSQLMPAPAVPFRAEGRVSIAGGLAVADRLTGEIGGSPTSGAVALRLEPAPRLDVAMTASRLDLDGWAPALMHAAAAGALHGMPIGIDLSAEAAQLFGGTLRRLRGAFDVDQGVVVVREASAMLPGDANLRLTGRILPAVPPAAGPPGAAPPGLRFDGTASLWAPALRTTLAWAAQDQALATVDGAAPAGPLALPPLVLRTARLSGHVVAERGQVAVDRMSGTLDGGPVAGDISLRPGPQALVQARLSLDRVDLDSWLPGGLPSPAALAGRLEGVRAELHVRAREARLRGVTVAPVSLDLGIAPGRLALRQLDFGMDGLSGTASGTLLEGGRIADGRLELSAAEATPLAKLLRDWLPGPGEGAAGSDPGLAGLLAAPIWRSPAGVQMLASGTAEALNLRMAAELGDLKLEAQPVLDLSGPAWRWVGPVTLRHPGAPRLAASLGLAGAPGWLGDGSLGLVAQVTAGPARIALDSFSVTAGGLHAGGALALDRSAGSTGGGPTLTGRIVADTLPLPLPSPRAPQPLPMGLLAGWQARVAVQATHVLAGNAPLLDGASATLSLTGGVLRLDDLAGKMDGGALTGAASLDSRASPPALAVQGALTGVALPGPLLDEPFDITAGTLDAQARLAASGYSPAALLASLSGTLRLTVRDGALAGVDLPRIAAALPEGAPEPAVRAALAGGSMGFDKLDLAATLAGGVLTVDQARLGAPSGTIDITGGISLPDGSADLHLALHPAAQARPGGAVTSPPVLGLRITGKLAAPQRAPELADLIRWRAEYAQ